METKATLALESALIDTGMLDNSATDVRFSDSGTVYLSASHSIFTAARLTDAELLKLFRDVAMAVAEDKMFIPTQDDYVIGYMLKDGGTIDIHRGSCEVPNIVISMDECCEPDDIEGVAKQIARDLRDVARALQAKLK